MKPSEGRRVLLKVLCEMIEFVSDEAFEALNLGVGS
jgi:hypothetical protein